MKSERSKTAGENRGGTYLLTWTTYGSWLCGDERGFVGEIPDGIGGYSIRNLPGEPYDFDEPMLRASVLWHKTGDSVRLGSAEAAICLAALREVSTRYGLVIRAGAVMTTHVHLVVDSPAAEGARLLNLYKGVSSRRLLVSARAIDAAIAYVLNQPSPLAVFDDLGMRRGNKESPP